MLQQQQGLMFLDFNQVPGQEGDSQKSESPWSPSVDHHLVRLGFVQFLEPAGVDANNHSLLQGAMMGTDQNRAQVFLVKIRKENQLTQETL